MSAIMTRKQREAKPTRMQPRVLIVDDDVETRDALKEQADRVQAIHRQERPGSSEIRKGGAARPNERATVRRDRAGAACTQQRQMQLGGAAH
jgi:hypothetical protein